MEVKANKNNPDISANQFETLTEALTDLNKRGFTKSFEIFENGAKCTETGQIFEPENVIIEEFHRFEGESSSDDMAVVYAITTDTGLKGTFVDAYGTYSNSQTDSFLKRAKFKKQSS